MPAHRQKGHQVPKQEHNVWVTVSLGTSKDSRPGFSIGVNEDALQSEVDEAIENATRGFNLLNQKIAR